MREKITEKEVDELLDPEEDEAAKELAEELFGNPVAQIKKRGRQSKTKALRAAVINKEFDDEINDMIKENTEIAPAQINPMENKIPEAVRNVCTKRMEELEKLMQDINRQANDLKTLNKRYEAEYKVLADFILQKGQ